MQESLRRSFKQWDRQEVTRKQNLFYIQLNNTYLDVERSQEPVTVHQHNQLCLLVGQAYNYGDPMVEYWRSECQKLPGWLVI